VAAELGMSSVGRLALIVASLLGVLIVVVLLAVGIGSAPITPGAVLSAW
jgi:hypothetical protein